eukprot:2333482-Prymnesium_polylepis.1
MRRPRPTQSTCIAHAQSQIYGVWLNHPASDHIQYASPTAPLQLVFLERQLARIDVADAKPLELSAGPALRHVAHLTERA